MDFRITLFLMLRLHWSLLAVVEGNAYEASLVCTPAGQETKSVAKPRTAGRGDLASHEFAACGTRIAVAAFAPEAGVASCQA